MAPEFGVGSTNYSLRACLGKFRVVNDISCITGVRVIPPCLGRQILFTGVRVIPPCLGRQILFRVTQESPRGDEGDVGEIESSLDSQFSYITS